MTPNDSHASVGTEDEQIGGTLAYQAPELLEGGQADRCSDIYALGVTAFEIITGQLPYTTDEIMTIFQENGQRVLSDPANFVPDILPELRKIIVKACQHAREERYQDVTEIIGDLTPVLNQDSVALPSLKEQQESATITFNYSGKQQEDMDRLLLEFSRRSRDLDIEIQIFKNG